MTRAPRGPATRRRGVVIVIVGALILVVAIGAFMLQQAMRQQYREAHRYTFGEIALNIAESGINLAMENVRESALQPGTELYTVLLETSVDDINGVSVPIPSPHLDELVALFGGDATGEVQIEFRNFQSFYPASGLRGVERDPREKFGELAVVSRGSYRGVARTIVASKQVKVVDVTAPVISKFSLFLRDQGGQDPNILRYDRLKPREGFRKDGEKASPLVVYNREDQYPAVESGRFLPMAPVFTTLPPDDGGLIYLGGDNPWYLNLVHGIGAGPLEELFHLRRTRYRMESDFTGIRYEYGLTFGFYDGLLRSNKFGSVASPSTYPRPEPPGAQVTDATSALHLFGDVRNVTPTVVLGPVFRSYVSIRLLDGLWYPYRSPGEFGALPQSAPFNGDYDAYSRVMCKVENESYNRSYDYIVTNSELLQSNGRVTAEDTPFVPGPYLTEGTLTRVHPAVDGDENFLYPRPGEDVAGLVRLSRQLDEIDETVFRGALGDIDGSLIEKMLVTKAVYAVEDATEFRERYVKDGKLDVPGIVHVKRGDLELGDVEVQEPCMVLVQGSVQVTGAISVRRDDADAPVGGPLTLVALSGDLRIGTGERVRASLVAMRGQVSSRGKLDLVGSVAARSLDLRALVTGEEPKTLLYDHALDPTWTQSYRRHLRSFLDTRVTMYVEGH